MAIPAGQKKSRPVLTSNPAVIPPAIRKVRSPPPTFPQSKPQQTLGFFSTSASGRRRRSAGAVDTREPIMGDGVGVAAAVDLTGSLSAVSQKSSSFAATAVGLAAGDYCPTEFDLAALAATTAPAAGAPLPTRNRLPHLQLAT